MNLTMRLHCDAAMEMKKKPTHAPNHSPSTPSIELDVEAGGEATGEGTCRMETNRNEGRQTRTHASWTRGPTVSARCSRSRTRSAAVLCD